MAQPCSVRDLTVKGASIRLNGIALLPVEFEISFDGFRTLQPSRLIWRDGDSPVCCSSHGAPNDDVQEDSDPADMIGLISWSTAGSPQPTAVAFALPTQRHHNPKKLIAPALPGSPGHCSSGIRYFKILNPVTGLQG